MYNPSKFDASDKTIRDVFQKTYKIPDFQRPYSWEKDQIDDLWNDVIENREVFFLGSFVFSLENKENYIVIDGQQRLITLTILFAALRDFLFEQNIQEEKCKKIAQEIQSNLIEENELNFYDEEKEYRIIPSDNLINFFKKYIQEENAASNLKKLELENTKLNNEQSLIISNYKYIKNKIEKLNKDPIETSRLMSENILNLKIIWIETDNDEDAYTIFEIVNARGMELTTADLLKNLILKNIKINKPKFINEAKSMWNEVVENIEDIKTISISRFIRHVWISKYNFVSEKKIYSEIKKYIKNYDDFLKEIHDASIWYSKFFKPDEFEWTDIKNGQKIYKSLLGISAMNINQCYVLFLSLLRNINRIHFNISYWFSLIEDFSFKYSAICKLQANKVEKLYSEYARKIESVFTNKSIKSKEINNQLQSLLNALKNELNDLSPNENLFTEKFKELSLRESQKNKIFIKYVLDKINSYFSKTREIMLDFNEVNIEHIYPKKPDSSWSYNIDKKYINLIGNLTIISKRLNSEASNKNLEEKIKYFEKSELKINNELVDFIKKNNYIWNEKIIMGRQENLAKLAYCQIWNKIMK
jgi:uncharacterized protein with ParB-like and HNH nuclease domain